MKHILMLLKIPFASIKATTITLTILAATIGGSIVIVNIANTLPEQATDSIEAEVPTVQKQTDEDSDVIEEIPKQTEPQVISKEPSSPQIEKPTTETYSESEPAPAPTPISKTIIYEQKLFPNPTGQCQNERGTKLPTVELTATFGPVNLNDKWIIYYKKYDILSNTSIKENNYYEIAPYTCTNGVVKYQRIKYKINGDNNDYEFRFYNFDEYFDINSCGYAGWAGSRCIFDYELDNLDNVTISSIDTIATYHWSWEDIVSRGAALDENKCSSTGFPCERK